MSIVEIPVVFSKGVPLKFLEDHVYLWIMSASVHDIPCLFRLWKRCLWMLFAKKRVLSSGWLFYYSPLLLSGFLMIWKHALLPACIYKGCNVIVMIFIYVIWWIHSVLYLFYFSSTAFCCVSAWNFADLFRALYLAIFFWRNWLGAWCEHRAQETSTEGEKKVTCSSNQYPSCALLPPGFGSGDYFLWTYYICLLELLNEMNDPTCISNCHHKFRKLLYASTSTFFLVYLGLPLLLVDQLLF